MVEIPIGTFPSAVRQQIEGTVQISGVVPQLQDGAAAFLTELQPVVFNRGVYKFAEVKRRILLGDPSVPGTFLTLRLQDDVDNDRAVTVEVVDGAAEAVQLVNGAYVITINTGVSTYASLKVLLDADALFSTDFSVEVDGLGAGLAFAQAPQSPVNPPQTVVDAADGGVFVIGNSAVDVLELHLECGVGSVVTVTITDPDGTHPRVILTGQSGHASRYPLDPDLYMLPYMRLVVEETAKGVPAPMGPKYITLYAVKRKQY